MRKLVWVWGLIVLLAACKDEPPTPSPSATALPQETATAVPTATFLPSPLPTPTSSPLLQITPSPVAMPTVMPTAAATEPVGVEVDTAVSQPHAAIVPENVTQLTELARWGRGTINDLALSADGHWLAVAASHGVYIHDLQNFQEPPRYLEMPVNVTAVAISLDGRMIAAVLTRHEIQVWQTAPAALLYTWLQDLTVMGVTFSPDGEMLAVTMGDHVELWRAANGELVHAYAKQMGIDFSPDSSKVAVWDYGALTIYDWQTDTLLAQMEPVMHIESGYYQDTGLLISDAVFWGRDDTLVLAPQVYPNGNTGSIEIH